MMSNLSPRVVGRWLSATLILGLTALPASADPILLGVVTDFGPRNTDKPAVSIERPGEPDVPVLEQQVVFEGDRFRFEPDAGKDAFVVLQIGAKKEVRLTPESPEPPKQGWSVLQTYLPRLVMAYRWINPTGSPEHGETQNALARDIGEPDPLSVLPKAPDKLAIADTGDAPLWIGWQGGVPPFKLTVQAPGAPAVEHELCKDVPDSQCPREDLVAITGAAGEPLEITVQSSDGDGWSKLVGRVPLAWSGDLADTSALGDLGIFLRAAELMDRDGGVYVLEAARMLAPISQTYPPARALLDQIRAGSTP